MLSYALIGAGYYLLIHSYKKYLRMIHDSESALAPNPASWSVFGLISFGNGIVLRNEVSLIILGFPFLMGTFQLLIAYFSYQKRRGRMETFDIVALLIGVLSLGAWVYLKLQGDHGNWWLPIFMIFIADAVGFYPTIRDAWRKPSADDPIAWLVFTIAGGLILLGLAFEQDTKRMDLIYPGYETLLAISTWLVLLYRRR